MKKACMLLLVGICFLLPGRLPAEEVSDEYLAGYTKAVLEREFDLPAATVKVYQNTIRIRLPEGKAYLLESIRSALGSLPADKQIRYETGAAKAPETPGTAASASDKAVFLPDRPLFDALLADPRWPHFSMSYLHYGDGEDLENVGHATFGESFVFYRKNSAVRWELGLQAGVFALFDLDAESYDLINADYRVSLPVSLRWHALSGTFRILHQSSHLGDEFILRGRAEERKNLSYEKIDGLLSIDLPLGTRLYGGSGYLIHKNPSDLEPWSVQGGLEWICPYGFFDGLLHPLAAVDVQNEEENDWRADVSAKAGLQLGGQAREDSNRLQLTLEYYHGHSPNGQFYDKSIEYVGLGLHYYR